MLNLFFIYLLINIKLLGVASNLINSETTDTITTTTDSTHNAVLSSPSRHHQSRDDLDSDPSSHQSGSAQPSCSSAPRPLILSGRDVLRPKDRVCNHFFRVAFSGPNWYW